MAVPQLLLMQCVHYCTGRKFYYVALIDKKMDNKIIFTFGVLTHQSWSQMNEVAFLGFNILESKAAAKLLMPYLNSTLKSTPRYQVSKFWGVALQIYDLLNMAFHTATRF